MSGLPQVEQLFWPQYGCPIVAIFKPLHLYLNLCIYIQTFAFIFKLLHLNLNFSIHI